MHSKHHARVSAKDSDMNSVAAPCVILAKPDGMRAFFEKSTSSRGTFFLVYLGMLFWEAGEASKNLPAGRPCVLRTSKPSIHVRCPPTLQPARHIFIRAT